MRDLIVASYKLHTEGKRVVVEDHSFRYWSVAEIVLRNRN